MSSTFLITASDEFQTAAREELKTVLPELEEGEILAPGLFLVSSSLDEVAFADLIAQSHLIYVRHIFPVQTRLELENSAEDLTRLSSAALEQAKELNWPRKAQFSVQARLLEDTQLSYNSLAIKEAIAKSLTASLNLQENIKTPEYIVSVVCAETHAYLGLSKAAQNLSSWAGGMRHYAKRPDQISRAEFKLLEALEVFGLTLPSEGEALDLGAAPGGWTKILLEAGLKVTAVDPAALDPRLEVYATNQSSRATQAHSGRGQNPKSANSGRGKTSTSKLEHYQGYAQEFLKQAAWKGRKFEVICSDIRMDAIEAAQLMAEFAVLLSPTGFALTTLKLPHETKKLKPEKLVTRALEILKQSYSEVYARQLFHNRQEVTAILRP